MQVSLDSVISNDQLGVRPRRTADPDAERRALDALARELAGSPRRVLQCLSDTAMRLCRAHSAGISLVEELDGRQVFRWHAVSGGLAGYLWSTLPRDFSPCGTVLDRAAPQFMILPERHFTPLAEISPRVQEVLLIPFSVGEVIVGTVWVVAHDETCRFDNEDRRVVGRLSKFAAVAYAGLSALSIEDVLRFARLHKRGSLPRQPPPKPIQRRVIVVDDGAAADTLSAFLRTLGHRVHVAHDARSACAAAQWMRPDLVLVDVATPGSSAHDTVAQIREALGLGARIAAIGDDASDAARHELLASGFDRHFVKPVDEDAVRRLLEERG